MVETAVSAKAEAQALIDVRTACARAERRVLLGSLSEPNAPTELALVVSRTSFLEMSLALGPRALDIVENRRDFVFC